MSPVRPAVPSNLYELTFGNWAKINIIPQSERFDKYVLLVCRNVAVGCSVYTGSAQGNNI